MNQVVSYRPSMIMGGTAWLVLVMVTSAWSAEESSTTGSKPEPAQLSVAPLDHIEYPDDRPQWLVENKSLDEEPSVRGVDHKIVIVSLPCDSAEQSLEELQWMQRAAIATYVSQMVDAGGEFDFYSPSDEEIENDLISKRYTGQVVQGDSTRYESAVELHFDSKKRDEIRVAWKNIEVGDRLKALGGLTTVGLVLLICTSGLLGIVSRRFPAS
ncbi:hypothetical protein [Rubripirellula reticaptiva]|uniref:Uncharacterized protein n=1 Tax=Rubripirellula reticaptiva TaxID=2528013 RepID=A0A5C6F970_9BACT|nr:hypothetical protein [Rubripirellula reticaptiva]TWU57928.1 hypothetical protein Poly59_08370 [Rubripirellula reticaptiva]